MRKTLLSTLSILLLSACAQGYVSGTETTPALFPSDLPKITALNITENAKASTGYTAAETKYCGEFKVTQAQALAFFNSAKIVNASDAHHTVDVSPCFARGDLTLAFEGPAKWTINQGGSATLTKKNGKDLQLFCAGCILGNVP